MPSAFTLESAAPACAWQIKKGRKVSGCYASERAAKRAAGRKGSGWKASFSRPPGVPMSGARFRDGKPMTPKDVLTGGGWGYSCLIGQLHHGTMWMPKRFQAEATTAYKLLEKTLKKKTRAQLVTFIDARRGKGIPARQQERKGDLLTRAQNLQRERLYPHQPCPRSDK